MQGAATANDQEMNKPTQNKQKCPRCNSFNTKFCYYNNYNLSQPRYFCKSCRRYWTHGGTLRNVPVGGGSRKAKRPKTLPSSSSTAALTSPLSAAESGGCLTSLEAIHRSTLKQSEQSCADWSFGSGGGDRNPTWTTVDDNNTTNSSSGGNNKNSSAELSEMINCCNFVQNQLSHHDHDYEL